MPDKRGRRPSVDLGSAWACMDAHRCGRTHMCGPTRGRPGEIFGEVSERLKEPVSKTGVRVTPYRGFESPPLRFRACFGLFCTVFLA